jgi:hypothetical protein
VVGEQARAALAHTGEAADIAARIGLIRKLTVENADAVESIVGAIGESGTSNGHLHPAMEDS